MKDDDVFVCKEKPDDPEASDAEFPIFGLLDQVRETMLSFMLIEISVNCHNQLQLCRVSIYC